MAIQLGSAYGKVSLDTKGFISGIKGSKEGLSSLESSAKKLGDSMKSLGQKMTVGVTLPIAAMGVAAVKAASDLNETMNKVDVVFKENAQIVTDWSKNSATAMGLSRQEALEAAATFGNLFTAMGQSRDVSAQMSTSLVTLAGDLASFNNLDPSVVLLKLKSGIVGETEAVRDLGIDLRQTVVEAKAAEMGFKEVNGVFSQGDLIAARYAIIMEQTSNAQGDFKRTSDALANSMRITNAEWKDALATLGKNLLPIAIQAVHIINRLLEAFNNLSPAQQKTITYILLIVAAIGPLLIVLGTLLPLIHLTTRSLNPFSGGILGLVFGFAKLISALAIVVKILEFFGVSLGPIGAGILSLNTAIAGIGGTILVALTPVLILLAGIAFYVGILYIMWRTNFLGMRDNVTMFVNVVKNLWRAFMAFLRGDTDGALKYLGDAFQAVIDRITKLFSGLDGLRTAWSNFVTWLGNAMAKVRDYIVKTFSGTDWTQVGRYILYGIANGMLLGLPTLLATAARVAAATLAQIKNSLGIHSDSKEGIKIGYFLGHGITAGVPTGWDPDTIARTISRPVTAMSNAQQQVFNIQFASGLTTREVQGMISQNNEQLIGQLNRAIGVS
jgi:hypothetical protein